MASSASILDRPAPADLVRFPAGTAPRFLVTIDTEEEFDWGAPFRREGHGTASIPAFARFQQFCEGFGVVPIFLMDYPVATAPVTAQVLGPALAAGKTEVGIHLHPWVNPPHEEDVNEFNSYAGNLPEELERQKLHGLRDAIEAKLGTRPLIYRAGRYGVGPSTARILAEAGVVIDTSVRTLFDYGSDGGPCFRRHPRRPYWIGGKGKLLELPVTTVFTGLLRGWGEQLYPRFWRAPRMRGISARLGLLERIPLTPEGTTPAEAARGIDAALAEGLPMLVFSFHSPSLAPGHTPYVRDAQDLEAFYDWWRQVFAHLAARGVEPTSVRELTASLALA